MNDPCVKSALVLALQVFSAVPANAQKLHNPDLRKLGMLVNLPMQEHEGLTGIQLIAAALKILMEEE